jgi:succinate dehydrogenase flavin-adding protein (antitoxin of CptAB toxin-antitoxin module)
MADDAYQKMRELLARSEKRVLAWVSANRPDLHDKPLPQVIATLQKEERQANPDKHRRR